MAQYDIRFAKKINRIQQAMIQELNKMAMIHLYLLGYSGEDLTDFTLTLTNPSTQAEQLKAELFREKAQTYTELTRTEAGIAAMSHTNAKRLIWNMSDKEIVEDLKQQKLEKVIMQELQDAPVSIKKTGLFADIDKRYGSPVEGMPMGGQEGMPAPEGGAGAPGLPPAGGAPTGAPPLGGGMPEPTGGAPAPLPSMEESFEKNVHKLVYGDVEETESTPKNKKELKNKKIIHENDKKNSELNSKAESMITEIDNLINEGEQFNSYKEEPEINLEEIDVSVLEGEEKKK